ncbi:hypothetical protein FOZ63_026726, partial [Perkinsus olseni]
MQHDEFNTGSSGRPSVIRTYCVVLPVVLVTLWIGTAIVLEAWKADRTRGQPGVPDPLTRDEYLYREERLGIPNISFAPLRIAARWLFYCQPELSLEVGSAGGVHSAGDERFASWYLSPQQQILEYLIYSIIFVASIVGGVMRGHWTLRAPARDKTAKMKFSVEPRINRGLVTLEASGDENRTLTFRGSYGLLVEREFGSALDEDLIELLNAIITTLLALGAICYKSATAMLARREGVSSSSADVLATWFLLQPCHVFCIALAVIYWSRRWKVSIYFFNLYLHLMWGVALALVFAEMEEYYKRQYPLEIFHFYLDHWVLVIAPFVLIALRTYPVFKPRLWFCYSFAAAFHSCILQPLHFVLLVQINYQTHPPGGPLRHFGKLYRPVQYIFCWLLTYLFSQCIIPAWVSFCEAHIWPRLGRFQQSEGSLVKESEPVNGRVDKKSFMSATVDSLVKTILKGGTAGEVTRQLSWVKDANA